MTFYLAHNVFFIYTLDATFSAQYLIYTTKYGFSRLFMLNFIIFLYIPNIYSSQIYFSSLSLTKTVAIADTPVASSSSLRLLFLSLNIHLSTQKKIHPPIKFATMVATATFQPPIHTMHTANIGELNCHRTRYKKNFFIFTAFQFLVTSIILSPSLFIVNHTDE